MNILMAVGFIAIPVVAVAVGVGLKARHNVKVLIEEMPVQLHLPDGKDDHWHEEDHVGHLVKG